MEPQSPRDTQTVVVISNRVSGNVVEVPEDKVTPDIVGLIIKGQILSSLAGFIVGTLFVLRGSFMAEHHVGGELAYKIKIMWFEIESTSIGVLLMAVGVLILILSYFWVRVTPSVRKVLPGASTPPAA